MPGRLFLTAAVAEVAGHFDAATALSRRCRRSSAPGEAVPAVVPDGGRRLVTMRWGLIPMGRTNARGRPVLETIVNARSETLFAKSAFAGLGPLPGGGERLVRVDRRAPAQGPLGDPRPRASRSWRLPRSGTAGGRRAGRRWRASPPSPARRAPRSPPCTTGCR